MTVDMEYEPYGPCMISIEVRFSESTVGWVGKGACGEWDSWWHGARQQDVCTAVLDHLDHLDHLDLDVNYPEINDSIMTQQRKSNTSGPTWLVPALSHPNLPEDQMLWDRW